MIRPLNPLDLVRYSLTRSGHSGNRAYTADNLSGERRPRLSLLDTARLSLSLQSKGRCSVAWTESGRVAGVAVARPRSGPRAWEVAHLLLASDEDSGPTNLLNGLCQRVARKRGERVFIRLRRDDPLVDVVSRSGYLPCARELVFKGGGRLTSGTRSISVREKSSADDYGLFRLYLASSPSETRLAVGSTFDQWASSRERTGGRAREFVFEKDGEVNGWLRTVQRFGIGQLTVVVHPDEETNIGALTDYGLDRLKGANAVHCVVPDYQELLQGLLLQRGYELVSEYVTLVKSMVVRARNEEDRRAVTAASV